MLSFARFKPEVKSRNPMYLAAKKLNDLIWSYGRECSFVMYVSSPQWPPWQLSKVTVVERVAVTRYVWIGM